MVTTIHNTLSTLLMLTLCRGRLPVGHPVAPEQPSICAIYLFILGTDKVVSLHRPFWKQ